MQKKRKIITKKLPKSTYPQNHSPSDFSCSGPTATKDGEFSNTKLADLVCFKQGKTDSNKFYHAAVVVSKLDGSNFLYTTWGRVGGHIDFQFLPCSSADEAQKEYEKQLHKKNDKRGEWFDHPKLGKILRNKPNKDVYRVSPKSSRDVGLPDAANIGQIKSKICKSNKIMFDKESDKLLRDLNSGAISYTRTSIVGGNIPTIEAIVDAKKILDEAVLENNRSKTDENALYELTQLIYSKIPKVKAKGSDMSLWVLNPNNIRVWEDELDVYESALKSAESTDISSNYPFELQFLPFNSEIGSFVKGVFDKSTANKHSYISKLKLKNIWEVNRKADNVGMKCYQEKIGNVNNREWVDWHPRPKDRPDIDDENLYKKTFTTTLWHGSRSCNIASILDKCFVLPRNLSGVQTTGALYGSGTYFASDRNKSVGYTSYQGSYWSKGSGGIRGRGAFMLLVDVVLGKTCVPRYGQSSLPTGYDSFWAKSRSSGIANDEFIIFNEQGRKIRYIVEFE